MCGCPNRVLGKCRVFVAVGIAHRCAKALNVIMGQLVRIGTQWSQFQPANHRLECEWGNFDRIEDVLSAKRRREKVLDMREQGVAAELPRMPRAFAADSFGRVLAMFAGLAGQNGGPPKPSIIPGIRVSGEFELLSDHCRSREYCNRKWLIRRQERALVSDPVAVSVATCSVPLSEML